MCSGSPTREAWEELYPLVARCHTLLKTRYSNPAFWKRGEQLFSACLKLRTLSPAQQAKLEACYKDTYEALQAAEQRDAEAEAPSLEEVLFGFRRQQVGGRAGGRTVPAE